MATRKKYYAGTAVTFADMEAVNDMAEKIWELSDLTYVFDDLLWNIRSQQEILGVEATKTALDTLVDEYAARMRTVTNKTLVKQKGSTAILADESGQQYFYGIYTNAFWDLENEVLTAASHKEFLTWLDENPNEAPELWTFHEKVTSRKERATWWDYSDNYVQMLWPIHEAEVKGISDFMDAYTPGMSHGFNTLKQRGGKIEKYRTFEVSMLPLEYAANPYTSFYHTEEKTMTDEKYNVLVTTHGKEFADEARSHSSKMTALTSDLVAVEKSFKDAEEAEEASKADEATEETTDEETSTEETTETEETSTAEEASDEQATDGETSNDIAALSKTVAALAETMGEGFKSLQDIILSQQTQIIEMQEKNVSIAKSQQAFNAGLSKQRVVAKLLQSKTTIGTKGNSILSTHALAKKAPKATKEDSGGIASFMPN